MSATSIFRRTPEQLRAHAALFWPRALTEQATRLSVVPLLLATQDDFLGVLNFPFQDISSLFDTINHSTLSANLFLKHLMVLTDVGGELLQRFNDNFTRWFPHGVMAFSWRDQPQQYHFRMLPVSGRLTNGRLSVTADRLSQAQPVDDLFRDVIMLLLFGAASRGADASSELARCDVSHYIGRPDSLREHVKQRYLWVSRITAGSQVNSLGHLTERFVFDYLTTALAGSGITLTRNGTVAGISHTVSDDDRLTTFDIVAERNSRCVAIEITFQVTTNSVIERKAGQARARYEQLARLGHAIAYVIDGAGNFQRLIALATICDHSDCTVALTEPELERLAAFVREVLA